MTSMTNNRINFGSSNPYQINLRHDTDEKLIPAVISKLDPKNAEDLQAIKKIDQTWEENEYVNLILTEIQKDAKSKNFTPNTVNNYYAVELPGIEPLHEKVLGLIHTIFDRDNKVLVLNTMETKPDFLYKENASRKIKGIGEVLVAQAFKKALGFQSRCIEIASFANAFYQHIFDKANIKYDSLPLDCFNVDASNFSKFLNHVGEKYQIKF